MNEINMFLKALESLKLEKGTYVQRAYHVPTMVNAIKNYVIEIFVMNGENSKLIASSNRNYSISTKNHEELYIEIISQILKYYGIKQVSDSN